MGLLFGCVCVIIALFVVLLIYAVILRASVWITNKCLGESGGSGRRRSSYDDDEWDDDYDRPARRRGGTAIPEPDLGKGMGISFLVIIVQAVIGFVIGLALGVGMGAAGGGGGGGKNPFGPQPGGGGDIAVQLLANCVSLVVGFLVWSGILTAMLPTSFGRAALVTVFIHLFLFAIGVIVVIAVFVIGFAGAAGGGGGFR